MLLRREFKVKLDNQALLIVLIMLLMLYTVLPGSSSHRVSPLRVFLAKRRAMPAAGVQTWKDGGCLPGGSRYTPCSFSVAHRAEVFHPLSSVFWFSAGCISQSIVFATAYDSLGPEGVSLAIHQIYQALPTKLIICLLLTPLYPCLDISLHLSKNSFNILSTSRK